MSKNPYHFRYHDDALVGYKKLTLEQRGAYTTLLDLMYSEHGFLEDDERRLAAEMMVSTRKYRSLRDGLLKLGKLYVPHPGYLSNRRVDEEIERRTKRSMQAKANGRIGGQTKAENNAFRKRQSPQFDSELRGRKDPRNISELSEKSNDFNKTGYQTSSSSRTRKKERIDLSYGTGDEEVELHPAVIEMLNRRKARGGG